MIELTRTHWSDFSAGSVNNYSIVGNISVSGKTYAGGFVGILNSDSTIDGVLIDGANLSLSSSSDAVGTVLGLIYNAQR